MLPLLGSKFAILASLSWSSDSKRLNSKHLLFKRNLINYQASKCHRFKINLAKIPFLLPLEISFLMFSRAIKIPLTWNEWSHFSLIFHYYRNQSIHFKLSVVSNSLFWKYTVSIEMGTKTKPFLLVLLIP